MTLALEHVTRIVGPDTHLDDISLTLARGSLNVLLGPTLSGKTSLMRIMAGLDKPTRGRVLSNGRDVTGVHVRKRSVAMVYQQFINYPSLSVYENIASPLRVKGVSGDALDRAVRSAADLLRIGPYLQRSPLELSGGQQQRCAMARALAKEAELVLLDEPLANLDYKLREELREELPRIFEASGSIFVYATTEPTEALLLGGATACLWQGRIAQFGPTPSVYRKPESLVAAQVFSDPPLNVMRIEKRRAEIRMPDGVVAPAHGVLARLPDGEHVMGVRAHEVHLEPPPQAIRLAGTVSVAEITGSESYIHLDIGDLRWVALATGVHEISPGTPIDVFIDPTKIFVFAPDGRLAVAPRAAAAA